MLALKVLNGSQAGICLPLAEDLVFRLGNHYDCDIFLEELELPESDCEFSLQLGGFQLTHCASELSLLDELSVPLLLATVYPLPLKFSCNGIQLIIADEFELSSPLEPAPLSNDELQLADIWAEPQANVEPQNSAEWLNELPAPDSALASQPLVSQDSAVLHGLNSYWNHLQTNFSRQTKLMRWILITGAAFLLVIILLIILSISTSAKQARSVTSQQQQLTNLKKSFAGLPNKYANLSFHINAQGVQISGLLAKNSDDAELKGLLHPYEGIIKYQLITVDRAKVIIQQTAVGYALNNLQVNYNPDSLQLRVSGLVMGETSLTNDLEIALNNQLPGIDNLELVFYSRSQLDADVNQALGDLKSFLQLNFESAASQLKISGYLTQEQLDVLQTNLLPLKSKYQSVVTINVAIANALQALPFQIYSVYSGNTPYFVTTSGQVVYLGGELAGFTVIKISDRSIIFKGARFTLEIPLNQINPGAATLAGHVQSFNSDGVGSRAQVLQEELDKTEFNMQSEESQLSKLNKYKTTISNPELEQFLQEIANNLRQDIQSRQQDRDYYNKELHADEQ